MRSRAVSRIVIALGLAAVFALGVSIVMLPALQAGVQNQSAAPASGAPLAAPARAASDLPAPDPSATTRDASAAPQAPPAGANPGDAASNPPPPVPKSQGM
jgi:hypothetical protein